MSVRVAVVGSLMMDLVVRVPRLPVVGESLVASDFQTFVGGKGGNQAIAAARLGAGEVAMIGRVGADAFGDEIIGTLRRDGVDCTFVTCDPQGGTGVAVPLVFDDGRNSIAAIPRANMRMTAADVRAARDAIEVAGVLLVQFEVAMEAVGEAVAIAHAVGVPILLNPAPVAAAPDGLLSKVAWLVPNEVEAAALAGAGNDPHAHAEQLRALGAERVVVTLGEKGALILDRGGATAVEAFPVQAIDSVGAGDAFCGALGVGLAEGMALHKAVRFASAAGAISVTRAGASPSLPARTEVEALLTRR